RLSCRNRQSNWPRPTSMATTRAAPRCSRQSVNPPVEAPMSRQTLPPTSIPKWSSAAASFKPPRLTKGIGSPVAKATRNGNQLAGLLQSLLTAEDLTGKDQRLRLRAGLGQPPRHEQLIQALLVGLWFHRDLGSGEWGMGIRCAFPSPLPFCGYDFLSIMKR